MAQADRDRLKAIFDEAVELAEPERREFVDRACGVDADLHRQVTELLRALGDAGPFLSSTSETKTPGLAAAPRQEGAGTCIGPYKLLQLIGEGGFGDVFMAEQQRPVRRRVALKVIKLGMDTKETIARFEAERQALAMMDHPNIAKVFDGGATPSGRPYFVMELVNGVPITRFADDNRLTLNERLDLFIPVCHAVQHAHQRGVIHRDIKPSNILVTLHDGRPAPKVIDFGIAKATRASLTEKTLFTEFRRFVGTPEYMSPEQAEMSGLDVDTRADVYSLGVVLYELLTGATPLDGKMLRSAALGEVLRIIREVEPPKPSTRLHTLKQTLSSIASQRQSDPTRLTRSLRGELDWIVMRCLEKDRTRRYESAGGLARDIQRFLSCEPVAAGPPSARYRAGKFIRRNKGWFAACATALVLLVAAVVGTSWQAYRATVAEAEQRDLRIEADNARFGEANQRRIADERTEAALRLAYRNAIAAAEATVQRGGEYAIRPILDSVPVERRGWEWRYLDHFADPTLLAIKVCEPGDPVPPMSVCADGRRLIVFDSKAKQCRFYSLDAGELLASAPLADEIEEARGSPDGTRAWIRPVGKSWRLVDISSGRVLWSDSKEAIASDFVDGGRRTHVLCLHPGRLLTLDAESGQTVRTDMFPGADALVAMTSDVPRTIHVARDGSIVVASGAGVAVVQAENKNVLWEAWKSGGLVTPDEAHVLTYTTGEVNACEILTGRQIAKCKLASLTGRSGIILSPDGQLAYVWHAGGRLSALAAPSLTLSFTLPVIRQALDIQITPDGSRLVVASSDGYVRVIAAFGNPRAAMGPRQAPMTRAFSLDGARAATGGWGMVTMYDALTGRVLWTRCPQMWFAFALAFSPDGRFLACQGNGATVLLLDAMTGQTVRSLGFPFDGEAWVASLTFTPDGAILAAGVNDGSVRLLRTEPGSADAQIGVIRAPWRNKAGESAATNAGSVRHLEFVPSTSALIAVTTQSVANDSQANTADQGESMTRLWKWGDWGKPVWETKGSVRAFAVNPRGDRLATASLTGVDLWDAASGNRVAHLMPGPVGCRTVAFSPDGLRLAAGCEDGDVRLWPIDDPLAPMATGAEEIPPIAVIRGPTEFAWQALIFAPDGSIVGACNETPVVRMDLTNAPIEVYQERERLRRAYAVLDQYRSNVYVDERLIADDPAIPAEVKRDALELLPLVLIEPRAILNRLVIAVRHHYAVEVEPAEGWEGLLRAAEIVERAYPDSPWCSIHKGHILCALKRYTEAFAALDAGRRALLASGENLAPMHLAALAVSLAELGKKGEAAEVLNAARTRAAAETPEQASWTRGALRWAEATVNPGAPR